MTHKSKLKRILPYWPLFDPVKSKPWFKCLSDYLRYIPKVRALARFLQEADPQRRWCNLERVVTPEGSILWLCPEHRDEYRV